MKVSESMFSRDAKDADELIGYLRESGQSDAELLRMFATLCIQYMNLTRTTRLEFGLALMLVDANLRKLTEEQKVMEDIRA